MLELERVDGKFNISGNLYDDEEAMRIADYIVNVLQDEHIESQVDQDMRSSQAEIDKEVGEWEYQAKFGDEETTNDIQREEARAIGTARCGAGTRASGSRDSRDREP